MSCARIKGDYEYRLSAFLLWGALSIALRCFNGVKLVPDSFSYLSISLGLGNGFYI